MRYLNLKFHRIIDSLIEITILGIVFFAPIFFAYILKTNNHFELSKIIFLKISVLFFLFYTITKLICNAGFLNNFFKRLFNIFFPKPNIFRKYFFLLILTLLYLILAIFTQRSSFVSYEEIYYRSQGWESLVFYILFFLLLILNIKENKQVDKIAATAFLASIIVSVYGLAQKAGFDFINWEEPALVTGRAFSSLGQPNFLASYLLLVIPFGFYLIFSTRHLLIKFIIFCGILINFLALYFTYSRGALVGLGGGVLTGLIIWFIFLKKKWPVAFLYKKFVAGFALILLFLFLVIFRGGFFLERLKSIIDFNSGSNAMRVNIWQASFQAAKEKPILGYGWESQQNVLVKYYKKDWGVHERVNMIPDRAHNLFLDIWLTIGIIGLLIYLALLFFLFKLIIDNIKNSQYATLTFFIFCGLVSYLISLMFNFAVVATDIYFWLFFALIIILNSNFCLAKLVYVSNNSLPQNTELIEGGRKDRRKILLFLVKIVLIIFAATLIGYKINLEFKKLIADHYFLELKRANMNNDYYKAFELFSYIEDLKVEDKYYRKSFSLMIAEWLKENDLPIYRKPGEKILEETLRVITNNNYFDVFARAEIYMGLATKDKLNYFNLAEENFIKAINLSPEMSQTYYEFANMYLKKGDFEKAKEIYYESLNFLPDTKDPRMNADHRQYVNFQKYLIYKKLGDLEAKRKNYGKAEEYYWLAFNSKTDDILLYRKIADTYYLRRDLERAIWYNKRGMMLNPSDPAWPLSIAFLYEEKKDVKKIIEYANLVLKIDPENKEAKKLIERYAKNEIQ